MADEQDVEVAIESATASAAVTVDVKPTETVTPDPAIAELQRQYAALQAKDAERVREIDAARQGEQQARTEAQRATQEVEQVRSTIADTELQATVSALAAANAEADAAAREHQAALEAGEFAKATEAQRKMARAEAKALRAEERKADLESGRPSPIEGRVEAPRPAAPQDRFESAIVNASPRTRDFLRSHREIVTDPAMGAKAAWVHQEAIKQGLAIDSDPYFAFAEQQLYPTSNQQPSQQTRSRPMTAAPPSRESSAATGGTAKTSVKLSAGEVLAATDGSLVWNTGPNKDKPIGVQEMARRKLEMMKNPKYAAVYGVTH